MAHIPAPGAVPVPPPAPAVVSRLVPSSSSPEKQSFDAALAVLDRATSSNEEIKRAKDALKALGIDVDAMKISKMNDPKGVSAHKVDLYVAKVGKDGSSELVLIEANKVLPTDAAKAAHLYAQQQVFFTVLAKQDRTHVYEAIIEHKYVQTGPGMPPKLVLQDMKITKFKPFDGSWYNSFGWYKNIFKNDTWTAADIHSGNEHTARALVAHEQQMEFVTNRTAIMPPAQARAQIYQAALTKMHTDRENAKHLNLPAPAGPAANDVQTFAQIHALPLPENEKKLAHFLANLEAGGWALDSDEKHKELMELMQHCPINGVKWNQYDQSDFDSTRAPNQAKIAHIAEFLKDFADYCQILNDPAKVAAFKTLKEEHKKAEEALANYDSRSAQYVGIFNYLDNRYPLGTMYIDLQEIADKLSRIEGDHVGDVNAHLRDIDGLLRQLDGLEHNIMPYLMINQTINQYMDAATKFTAALDALCPPNPGVGATRAQGNFSGLVTPKGMILPRQLNPLDPSVYIDPHRGAIDNLRGQLRDLRQALLNPDDGEKEKEI
jgi:hypothetical protein